MTTPGNTVTPERIWIKSESPDSECGTWFATDFEHTARAEYIPAATLTEARELLRDVCAEGDDPNETYHISEKLYDRIAKLLERTK